MRLPPGSIVSYAECNEMFPSPTLEMLYTTVVTVIQFLFPLVIAGLANAAIYSKLRDRLKTFSSMEANDKRKSDILRMKRFGAIFDKTYCQAQPKLKLQQKLAELSLILHFIHPPTPTPVPEDFKLKQTC